VDELLAAAQACILSEDFPGAQQSLGVLDAHPLGGGAVAARVRLCRAAIDYRTGRLERALDALPNSHDCSPPDAAICRQIRRSIEQRIQRESAMPVTS
jgi:hypothetical protein